MVNEGSFGGKDAVSHRMAMLDPVAKDHAVGTGSEPMIVREPALERFDVCTAFCQPVESITKSLPGLRGLFPDVSQHLIGQLDASFHPSALSG